MKTLILTTVLWLFMANHASAVELSGNLTQGGMAWGQVSPGSAVVLDGAPVHVGPKGHFVIGFPRDAGPQARLLVKGADGKVVEQTLMVAKREFQIERVNGLPPKTVTMPPEWLERRKVENGRVANARSAVTDDLFWLDGFLKPADGRFSGFYGSQRILNGVPKSPHYGLDVAGPVGTPVVAPAAGIVRLAAPDFLLEGGIVVIDHGFGVTSTLFHMNSVDVKEGQKVGRGEQVGTIGAKGRANGPHVDWRLNVGTLRLDPLLMIKDKVSEE